MDSLDITQIQTEPNVSKIKDGFKDNLAFNVKTVGGFFSYSVSIDGVSVSIDGVSKKGIQVENIQFVSFAYLFFKRFFLRALELIKQALP